MSKTTVALVVVAVALTVGGIAYAAGVAAGRASPPVATAQTPAVQPVQSQDPFMPPFQMPEPRQPFQFSPPGVQPDRQAPGQPPTLREFIPIPGPGDQMPGQQPQPDQGECEPIILFYHNGQLFQLRPGEGPENGPGRPGSPPEYFHMNPYQGPAIPGLPAPRRDRGPGFSPVNPRS
jgi:hypothetical protein